MGKILWVDLTTGQTGIERPGDELSLSYLGGYGLGAYYLYKTHKPGVDPPGPHALRLSSPLSVVTKPLRSGRPNARTIRA